MGEKTVDFHKATELHQRASIQVDLSSRPYTIHFMDDTLSYQKVQFMVLQ